MNKRSIQDFPPEVVSSLLQKAHKATKLLPNGCLVWTGNVTIQIQAQLKKQTYIIGGRQLLFFEKYGTLKNVSRIRNKTCSKNCVLPEHRIIVPVDPVEKKKHTDERDKKNVLNRIIKERNGCWTHIGARDAKYEGRVTTMRSAVYHISKGERIGNGSGKLKNKEGCLLGCINPDHVVHVAHSIERFMSACKTINDCTVYNGKHAINIVRRAFFSSDKKTDYPSSKRHITCHERCVEPTHRIHLKDDKQLFLNKIIINPENNCWNYQGCHIAKVHGVTTTVRRASWLFFRKGNPGGRLSVKKTCETWCVNPKHLIDVALKPKMEKSVFHETLKNQ